MLLASTAASAQEAPAAISPAPAPHQSGDTLPDPKQCVVLLEQMGDVGFRIADAQAVAETIQRAMRKRVGRDGVVYAGIAKSQQELQKMLGSSVETPEIQQKKLDYFKAAEQHAPWVLRARFGVDKRAPKESKHWITLSCRKKGGDAKAPLEAKRVVGATFADARASLDAALPAFCPQIPSAPEQLPIEGLAPTPAEPPGMRKKQPKPWTPPPPRP